MKYLSFELDLTQFKTNMDGNLNLFCIINHNGLTKKTQHSREQENRKIHNHNYVNFLEYFLFSS